MQDPVEFFFKISPFENSHDLLWDMNDTTSFLSLHGSLKTNIQRGDVQKKISISLTIATLNSKNARHSFAE